MINSTSAYNILIIGATGVGKSTLLNKILNKDIVKVGYGSKPETLNLDNYPLTSKITLWDSPGLGDGIRDKNFEKELRKILSNSNFIDIILIVVDINDKRISTIEKLINIVIDIDKKYTDKFLFILNKVDEAKSIRYWLDDENKPSKIQLQEIDAKIKDYQKRIEEVTKINIDYFLNCSAQMNYNLHTISNSLYGFILKKHLKER